MELFTQVIKYITDFIIAVTPQQWYVFGSILGGSGLLVGIIAWVKRRHLKKTLEKLEDWFVQANLILWGLLVTLTAFLVTYGLQLGQLFPFLAEHMPQLVLISTSLYTFSKPVKKWFADRKASKRHFADDLIDGIVDVPQTLTDVPPANLPPEKPRPSSNLLR